MNKVAVLVVVLLMLGVRILAQEHLTTKAPFRLVISAAAPGSSAGGDVWIRVKLANHSGHDLDDSGNVNGQTGLNPNYLFQVLDSRGNPVRKRVYPVPPNGQPMNRTIKNGSSQTEEQNIGRLFDMSQPGKYSIQVLRPIPSRGILKSNKLHITIMASGK